MTEEQVAEIQSRNSAKIQEFERNILGLRPKGAREVDPKWEEIQADVQQAMERDELSIDGDAEGDGSAPDRPEVFEQGPLYAHKSAADADDDAIVAPARHGEDEADIDDEEESEDDEDKEAEEQEKDEEQEEEEQQEEEEEEEEEEDNGDANEDGRVEASRQQKDLEVLLEGKAGINTTDIIEAKRKVVEDDAEEKDPRLSEDYPSEILNDANTVAEEPNFDDTSGITSGQESTNEARESTEQESQQADQEVVQTKTTAKSDVLAMTLTIRNKVNGRYILRPEALKAADEWSIEYSLNTVENQSRAQALYQACRKRRDKKFETLSVPEEAEVEVVNHYIQMLRDLSLKGRRWREEQDRTDTKRPGQVL